MTRRAHDEVEHARSTRPAPADDFGPLFTQPALVDAGRAAGRARRDTALDAHEQVPATQLALEYVRAELVALYQERRRLRRQEDAYVTADDADEIIRHWADCPAAVLALPSQNWRGSIFRGKHWRKLGRSVESDRAHLHATSLPCWAWSEAA